MDLQSNKKLDFSGESIYVGLDVHKQSWQVTIMSAYHEHKTFNQPPRVELLVNYLQRNFPQGDYHCAYEAGFSGFWACRSLLARGVNCVVVNPADVPTGDKEKRRKSDVVDSRKLARALRSQQLQGIYLPSVAQQEERSLLRSRTCLVRDLTRSKNRIKSFLHYHGIELPACYSGPGMWSKSFVTWLEGIGLHTQSGRQSLSLLVSDFQQGRALLLEATRRMRELSRSDAYAAKVACLRSIPGIGTLTAMTLLTEIGDIKRFKSLDKLCAFIGVIPDQRSSGEHQVSGGLTPRHNSMLRKMLVESARVAARKDPALMQCYNQYCKRMHPNKAIVHIMRKLLNRARWVLLHQQKYELGKVT